MPPKENGQYDIPRSDHASIGEVAGWWVFGPAVLLVLLLFAIAFSSTSSQTVRFKIPANFVGVLAIRAACDGLPQPVAPIERISGLLEVDFSRAQWACGAAARSVERWHTLVVVDANDVAIPVITDSHQPRAPLLTTTLVYGATLATRHGGVHLYLVADSDEGLSELVTRLEKMIGNLGEIDTSISLPCLSTKD